MNWIAYSTLAAMLWGVSYAIAEKLYLQLSVSTVLAMELQVMSIAFAIFAVVTGRFRDDIALLALTPSLWGWLVISTIIFTAAEICIATSVVKGNATLAAMVEISYPVFTALAAYLILGRNQLNGGVALGGLLIFAGAFLVQRYA